jgi:hypothetical protein
MVTDRHLLECWVLHRRSSIFSLLWLISWDLLHLVGVLSVPTNFTSVGVIYPTSTQIHSSSHKFANFHLPWYKDEAFCGKTTYAFVQILRHNALSMVCTDMDLIVEFSFIIVSHAWLVRCYQCSNETLHEAHVLSNACVVCYSRLPISWPESSLCRVETLHKHVSACL